jgi:hypothetical protein
VKALPVPDVIVVAGAVEFCGELVLAVNEIDTGLSKQTGDGAIVAVATALARTVYT